jgi:hypothetical protein
MSRLAPSRRCRVVLNASAQAQCACAPPQAVETFDAAWTIVRDTHFDRTFNGANWDSVRT